MLPLVGVPISRGYWLAFGLKLPQAISGPFNPSQGTYIDLLPVLVLVLVTALLLMNSKQALRLNSLLVVLKFSALAVFILVGLFHLNPNNWADFAPFGFGQILWGKNWYYGRCLSYVLWFSWFRVYLYDGRRD